MLPNDSDCGAVKIFGSSAVRTFASPAPSSSTDASCVRAVLPHAGPAVPISADLTCHGAQPGCRCRSSAAAPATWGVAIDVPAKTENVEPVVFGGVDESTSRPGAEISGFSACSKSVGPADEKLVITPLRPVGISSMLLETRNEAEPALASANARRFWPSRSEIIPAGSGIGPGSGFASPARLSTMISPVAPASAARSTFEISEQLPRRTSATLPLSEPFGSVPSVLLGSSTAPHSCASTGL